MESWTEEETHTLIEAWGERYISMMRGNLKTKQWEEIVDIVNSVHNLARTRIQCRNLIDRVKKRYKVEKAKIDASNGVFQSLWRFYSRVSFLIGNVSEALSPLGVAPLTLNSAEMPEGSGKRRFSNMEAEEDVEVEEEEDGLEVTGKAFERFGRVYEEVAKKKIKLMVELEKERMQFAKDMEVQRMKMFFDLQVELVKARVERDESGDEDS